MLKPSDTTTYCPYKGDASYYHVTTASGDTVEDVIWTYEQPYPAVGDIAGHVAFYPDKAEIVVALLASRGCAPGSAVRRRPGRRATAGSPRAA